MNKQEKCFNALMAAARRLDSEEFEGVDGLISVNALGVKVTMRCTAPTIGVEYLMAWEEISLTKFDLLDDLLTDMHRKLLVAIDETKVEGRVNANAR